MLPDFPEAKEQARRMFIKAVRMQIPKHSPVLAQIRRTRIHEGRSAQITREDRSTSQIAFHAATAQLDMPREQMRRITVEQLVEHAKHMAEQFAEQQTRLMFATIAQAVEEVGNSVSAAVLVINRHFWK